MKRLGLLFLFVFVFSSCDSENSDDPISKNATIFIDESEVDNCLYTIRTENNELYTTDNLPGEYSQNNFEARITYRVTEERGNCGFAGLPIKIKILKLIKK